MNMTLLRSLLSACLLFIVPAGFATDESSSKLDDAKHAVVKLRVHRSNQSDSTAAALYIGSDGQSAFFITACHAVIDICASDSTVAEPAIISIDLQFYSAARSITAKAFKKINRYLDLAVVYVPVSNVPAHVPAIETAEPTVTMRVHIVGHPLAGDWSLSSGHVVNLTRDGDIDHFTTSPDAAVGKGDSGGPVLDDAGKFLGLHVADNKAYLVELNENAIERQLLAWNLPRQNLRGKDQPEAQDVLENGLGDACLSALFKEGGPDSPLTWSLAFIGERLTGKRDDGGCWIDLTWASAPMDDGPAWDGELRCGNGHLTPKLALSADSKCQYLTSNISWFKLGPRVDEEVNITGEWAHGKDPKRVLWRLTQNGAAVDSVGESGPAKGAFTGKSAFHLRWNDNMAFNAEVRQNHLDWDTGTYWLRLGTTVEPSHSIATGRWATGSDPTTVKWTIHQRSDGSIVCDSKTGTATGKMVEPGRISLSWNAAVPITGVIQRDRIYWENGSYWIRKSRLTKDEGR
jgi:hypothetical protein